MGDLGSALSGAGSAIGGGLSDATSGLGGFGSALSGFGSALGALGGGGQSAGQAYGQGGVDPNTGQPIDQPTPQPPQTAQAQSQGPLAGATPPGTDPATVVGGTQSRPSQGYASVLQQLAKNVQPQNQPQPGRNPWMLPAAAPEPLFAGAAAVDPWLPVLTAGATATATPAETGEARPQDWTPPTQTGGFADPDRGGATQYPGYTPPHVPQWGPTHAGGSPSGPITNLPPDVINNPPLPPPRPKDAAAKPSAPSATTLPMVADSPLPPERPADPNAPAAAATPVAGTGDPSVAPQPNQGGYGQGGELANVLGGLMQMFLPLLFQGLLGGGMGGGMGAAMLPMLMGGMMGGGGFRPHLGMGQLMPFGRSPFGMMMGGRRMIPGFGGGMLRPGYYPDGRGRFGFHPGGWHGGWQPHYIGAYGNQGGGVTSAPQRGPWSNSPFLSTLVSAESGGRQGPGVRGDSGMAKGFFQFHDATWQRFARNVPGASQFRSAEDAPPEMQQAVAMTAPISEWGPRTKQILHQRFGQFDERLTIGQLAQMFGGAGAPAMATASNDNRGAGTPAARFRVNDPNPDPLTSHAYPAPTETGGANPDLQGKLVAAD